MNSLIQPTTVESNNLFRGGSSLLFHFGFTSCIYDHSRISYFTGQMTIKILPFNHYWERQLNKNPILIIVKLLIRQRMSFNNPNFITTILLRMLSVGWTVRFCRRRQLFIFYYLKARSGDDAYIKMTIVTGSKPASNHLTSSLFLRSSSISIYNLNRPSDGRVCGKVKGLWWHSLNLCIKQQVRPWLWSVVFLYR